MAAAVQTLEDLSRDPEIQRLARKRWLDIWFHEYGRKLERQEARGEGYKEGLERGLERGLEQGKVELLLEQIRARFGSLPDGVEARVTRASSDDLEVWAGRILTAETIHDVLADESPRATRSPRSRR